MKSFVPVMFSVIFFANCVMCGGYTIISLPPFDTELLPIADIKDLSNNQPHVDEFSVPVVYGQGRQLSIRPVEIPWNEPSGWRFFPWNEPAPATPDQSTIFLTESDSLMVAVPMFAYQPSIANFDAIYTRKGNQLQLDGFILEGGAVTATMYGPIEYLESIGTLPAGHYTLNVRSYFTWDCAAATLDIDEFKADPEGYASSHGINLQIANQTLDFTIVPEPGTAILLGFGLLSLFIKRMIRSLSIG
jgi:hypothetical protein